MGLLKFLPAKVKTILAKVWLPLTVFVICLAAVFAYTASQPKVYQATARIWIQQRTIPIALSTDGSGGGALTSPLSGGTNTLNTACEVIHSQSVTSLAHKILAKKLPADICPSADEIQGSVKADAVKDADIVKLSYEGEDPKIVLAGLESVIGGFFEENHVQTAGGAAQSKVYLEKQLGQAQESYKQSSENLKHFQIQNKAVDLESQVGAVLSTKADMERELIEAKDLATSEDTKLKYLEKQSGFKSDDVLTVDAIAGDEILQGLRQEIADYEVKLVDLRSRYQLEHPKMKRLQAALDNAKQAMASRLKMLLGKIDPKMSPDKLSSESPVRDNMIADMMEIRADQVASAQRIASIGANIQKVEGKLTGVPAQQLEYAELVRENEGAAVALSSVERELQNMALTESAAMGASNLEVIDHPTVADTTPNIQLAGIMAAISLALFAAFIQFMLDPMTRGAKPIASLLNLPVSGYVPTLPPGGQITDVLAGLQRVSQSIKYAAKEGSNVVLVTSSDPLNGKSTIAYALGLSLHNMGQRVLLVDANLEHPTLHLFCHEQASPGLVDLLRSRTKEQYLESVKTVEDDLLLVPAGEITPGSNPLATQVFRELLDAFREEADVVIIDSQATGRSATSLILPQDNMQLVVAARIGHCLKKSLKLLSAQIQMQPQLKTHLIVNDVNENAVASDLIVADAPVMAQNSAAPVERSAVSNANW